MRIKLDNNSDGVGGVARVYAGLYDYLPKHGVEIVNDIALADVVHAHIALYEKIPPDKPLVVSSHGMLWDENKWGGSAHSINKMCAEAYRQADVVTAPSDFVATALARNMCLPAKVVRHGINPDEWLPGENAGYVLWNKARVDAANNPKDVDTLASLATGVSFVSTFAKPAPNMTVIGQLPHKELKEYIQNAGVYLDTSKESGAPCFGILEAMACGVPILSWDFGGTREVIVHGETGYLAKPGDYNDLLNGLSYCLKHRKRMGAVCIDTVAEKYTWDIVIEGYIQAYQEALDKHRYTKTVSVIVPCYNLGKFLPDCLDSILHQSYTDWEVIVVDDASTDNSLEIAHDYAGRDARIKVLHNTVNLHVSGTRNKGIINSTGKYIIPLDADDRLEAHALRNMVGVLDTDRSVDIVTGKLVLFNDTDLIHGRIGEWPNNGDYDLQIQGYNRLPYASMYRRKVWERVGGYRTRIRCGVEDADFWTRALSYGCRPLILDIPTLYYTLRADGLGKKNEQGIQAWLPWFGWSGHPEFTPFGALTKQPPVRAYDDPQVSIVIPVGPEHTQHIQACIDSLLSQTNQHWEAIVINDTGERWGNLPGMPFVTFIDGDKNEGVAAARNKGILSAKTPLIIFLDVDDVAQPNMVDLYLRAHEVVGGWVYSDWYTLEDGKPVVHIAEEWDIERFKNKMLAPVTGLYEKQHLIEAGCFDETAPGWEDWDMQLALVSRGICGTRLSVPLIMYNMYSGYRREENFSRAENLLEYIKNKYKGQIMACNKCGGKKSVKVNAPSPVSEEGEAVLIKYVGPQSQTRYFKSKVKPGTRYKVDNKRPFFVFAGDAKHFLSFRDFVKIDVPKPLVDSQQTVLVSQEKPAEKTIDQLNLRPETIAFLKDFTTANELAAASDTQLLSVKGIGPSRLKEIREALYA